MTVFEGLRDYYQGIANSFSNEKLSSAVFPNATDKGLSREDILLEFLCNHLPKRCEAIKGGFIFDSAGNMSNQIDIIVTNDLTLQFRQFDRIGQSGKSFNCVEGCICALSIKTMLDKAGLDDSLENLASIPLMTDMSNRVNPLVGNKEKLQNLPFNVVFAFDGISVDTILSHINEFYTTQSTPYARKANLIIVNNKYVITYIGEAGRETRDGTKISPFTFHANSGGPYIGAYSLMSLLVAIQSWSTWGSQLNLTFDDYFNKMPF